MAYRFLKTKRLVRGLITLTVAVLVSLLGLLIIGEPSSTKAGISPVSDSGVLFLGDLSTTNQGRTRARVFTSPATFASQIDTAAASGTQYPLWITAKTAPTREEILLGTLKQNGTLDIQTCTSGCDASGDYTAQWNNAGTTATQDCDGTPTAGTCIRAFDIGYESLSGQGFVVYSDNTADRAYYARWDGSVWSPDSSPGSPSATNEIDLPGTAGTPRWIRIIPQGQNLDQSRTNRAMILISDTNSDLYAFYWDGSDFDSGTILSTALGTQNDDAQNFDGAWESPSEFVVVYGNNSTADVRYQQYTVGSGWGGDAQAFTTTQALTWISAASDPTSSRILVATNEGPVSGAESWRAAVWRDDNATDGWTVCAAGGCPDVSIEDIGGQTTFAAFERFGGEGMAVYIDAGASINVSDSMRYTPGSGFASALNMGLDGGTDDALFIRTWAHPNSDDILAIGGDIDCQLRNVLWTGSAWDTTASTALVADTDAAGAPWGLSNYGVDGGTTDCVANTAPQAPPEGTAMPFDFAWKMYSSWQRNWQFYSGSDTAATPSNSLASENTGLANFAESAEATRLRINHVDRGNSFNNTNSRRKLQYTSGCNPNSSLEVTCTWTDVDDPGGSGIWRYKDCDGGSSTCNDGQILSGTVLTDTNGTCTAGNGCGTFVLDKDATPAADMDHNAGIVQELEFPIESNGATAGATYYFRVYNARISSDGQDTPIYREQDSDDCGGGSAQCSYASITIASGAETPTVDQVMRHGNWFDSSGTEQGFSWVD